MSKSSHRVLVVGGRGLAGGFLSHYLNLKGFEVTGTSRQIRGQYGGVPFTRLDPSSTVSETARLLEGIESVVFAAGANHQICSDSPEVGRIVNCDWPRNLARAARDVGTVRRFVLLSTMRVYGDRLNGDVDENTPRHPSHPYGLSHLWGENSVAEALGDSDISLIALRPSNFVGAPYFPNEEITYLVPYLLVSSATSGRKVFLKSDGFARRDFVSLDFFSSIVENWLRDSSDVTQALNVASGISMSIRELVGQIRLVVEEELGQSFDVKYGERVEEREKPFRIRTKYPELWGRAGRSDLHAAIRAMVAHYVQR